MKNFIVTLLSAILVLGTLFGQDSTNNGNWKLYPTQKVDTAKVASSTDTIYKLKPSELPGKVTIIKDSRIDKVSQEIAGGESKKPKTKGYRVQVISSSTKSTVDDVRKSMVAANGQQQTYIDYKAPNFRLRVGNFRTRLEAEKFQYEIKGDYPNTLIVIDLIDFPELDQR